MDLTPYDNYDNSLNRSRSLSCGSPLRNQVVYQEVYNFGQNTLVRSVSCNQVFSKNEIGQTFETTQIQVSSFITQDKSKHDKSFNNCKKSNLKIVELNSGTNCKPRLVSNGKSYMLKGDNKFILEKSMCKSAAKYMFGALLSFLICFYIGYLEYSKTWDLNLIYNELQQKVYGQNEAIEKIKVVLEKYNKTWDLHTMIFTGSVGVGKTYVSSIIYQDFPWSSKKILFLDDWHSEINERAVNGLSVYGHELLIFDDLTYENVDETVFYLSNLNSKKKKNINILVILIFQTHTEVESNDILEKYENLYLNYYHIPFRRLTEEAVKQCFYREIQKQKVVISESEVGKLVKEKIKSVDVVKGPTGCKGIADEISQYL